MGARVVPLGEAVRENRLQSAVRHLRERAPLLDLRLFVRLVRGAGGGQGLQELGALRHARGEGEGAICRVDSAAAALAVGLGRRRSLVQQLQQPRRPVGRRGGLGRHRDAPRQIGEPGG